MGLRNSLDVYGGPDNPVTRPAPSPGSNQVLIDQMLGTSFDMVRHVAQNIEYVKHVSAHLDKIYRLAASASGIDLLAERADKLDLILDELADLRQRITALENAD